MCTRLTGDTTRTLRRLMLLMSSELFENRTVSSRAPRDSVRFSPRTLSARDVARLTVRTDPIVHVFYPSGRIGPGGNPSGDVKQHERLRGVKIRRPYRLVPTTFRPSSGRIKCTAHGFAEILRNVITTSAKRVSIYSLKPSCFLRDEPKRRWWGRRRKPVT